MSKKVTDRIEPIKFESIITIKKVPIQWISRIELYYPDLPGFPIVYVHTKYKGRRLYGFPVSISYKIIDDRYCNLEILFLCNKDIEPDSGKENRKVIISELEKRLGLNNVVTLDDVLSSTSDTRYSNFFITLWDKYISTITGNSIPYGNFYEEIFSIVRFVSAWNPKTGRQSEMRMLYNFLSIFGENIPVQGRWRFLDFFLLPTYDDLLARHLTNFPKFRRLFTVIGKIWNEYFTKITILDGVKIKSMKNGWPKNKDLFIKLISKPLFDSGKISSKEKISLERLVDAFNRNPVRTSFFISSIMLAFEKDYRKWDKAFFDDFYTLKERQKQKDKGSGISEKVIACFLQQGFGKEEITPIDTWVESFYRGALGINDKRTFLETFSKIGKMERIIWLSSQAKKTNIAGFFDILWCIRYGTRGNTELRGANPISCYECLLHDICPNYQNIKLKNVYVTDPSKLTAANEENGNDQIVSEKILNTAEKAGSSYICITDDGVPKKILEKRNKRWILIDEFSGYLLSKQRTSINNKNVKVAKLLQTLPKYVPEQVKKHDEYEP